MAALSLLRARPLQADSHQVAQPHHTRPLDCPYSDSRAFRPAMRGALQRLSALAVGTRSHSAFEAAVAQRAMSSSGPDVEAEVLGLVNKDLLRTQAYVNGEWIDAADGKTLEVGHPARLSATTARLPLTAGDSSATCVAASLSARCLLPCRLNAMCDLAVMTSSELPPLFCLGTGVEPCHRQTDCSCGALRRQ